MDDLVKAQLEELAYVKAQIAHHRNTLAQYEDREKELRELISQSPTLSAVASNTNQQH